MSARTRTVLAVLFVAFAALVVIGFKSGALSTTGAAQPAVPVSQTEEWVSRIRNGETASFVVDQNSRERITAVAQGTGATLELTQSERSRVDGRIRSSIRHQRGVLTEFRNELDPTSLSDLKREADMVRRLTQTESELRALEQGDFLILPMGSNLPFGLRDTKTLSGMDVYVKSEEMRLWWVMPYVDYPEVLTSARDASTVARAARAHEIMRFNGQSYDDRKRAFELSDEWRAKKNELEKDVDAIRAAGLDPYADPAIRQRSVELGTDPLPPHQHRDRVRYLLEDHR